MLYAVAESTIDKEVATGIDTSTVFNWSDNKPGIVELGAAFVECGLEEDWAPEELARFVLLLARRAKRRKQGQCCDEEEKP